MSTSAPCASRVSWTSTGRARALISWSLPLPSGYSTTSTSVISPSTTLIRTCTGPQRVCATSPVTESDDEPLDEDAEDPEVPPPIGAALDDSALADPDEMDVW